MTNNGKETKRESIAEMAIKIAQIAAEGKLTEETEFSKIVREKVRRKNREKRYQRIAEKSCFADFDDVKIAYEAWNKINNDNLRKLPPYHRAVLLEQELLKLEDDYKTYHLNHTYCDSYPDFDWMEKKFLILHYMACKCLQEDKNIPKRFGDYLSYIEEQYIEDIVHYDFLAREDEGE